MINFIRLLKCDFYKMKHTAFFIIHVLVPLIGTAIFLLYFATHSYLPYLTIEKAGLFIQIVSIVFPLLTSIVTSYAFEIEKNTGSYKEILCCSYGRTSALLSKIVLLLFCGFFSLIITVGTFIAGISIIDKNSVFSMKEFLLCCLILLSCEIFIYMFHIIINLAFNRGFSILMGIFETILSALMLTGLGDVTWKFLPCGFETRLIDFFLMKTASLNYYRFIKNTVYTGIINCVCYTIIMFILLLIYFNHYEPKSNL